MNIAPMTGCTLGSMSDKGPTFLIGLKYPLGAKLNANAAAFAPGTKEPHMPVRPLGTRL
jgi:hypothetical protein